MIYPLSKSIIFFSKKAHNELVAIYLVCEWVVCGPMFLPVLLDVDGLLLLDGLVEGLVAACKADEGSVGLLEGLDQRLRAETNRME